MKQERAADRPGLPWHPKGSWSFGPMRGQFGVKGPDPQAESRVEAAVGAMSGHAGRGTARRLCSQMLGPNLAPRWRAG